MNRAIQYVYRLTAIGIGALAACARAADERGAAPLDNSADMYVGQHVTMIGEVDQVRGEQTFTMLNSGLTSDEPLLVIVKRPTREVTMGKVTIFRGEWIRIRGTIQRLNASEVEQAYGFDLDPDLEVLYNDRPFVVTDWISEP